MEANKIELTDLVPQTATFELEGTGDVVHELRPVDLKDRAWLQEFYGGDKEIKHMLGSPNIELMMPLIYRLLVDKSYFPAKQIYHWYDDDGVLYYCDDASEEFKKVKKAGGIAEKADNPKRQPGYETMMHASTGMHDILTLRACLFKTIGMSNPEIEAGIEEQKKKMVEIIAKAMKAAGETYSTSSRTPTDGPTTTSRRSRSGKSKSQARKSKKQKQ